MPAAVGLSRPNSFLPEKHLMYVNHLPILMLGCKTNLYSLCTDTEVPMCIMSTNVVNNLKLFYLISNKIKVNRLIIQILVF